MGTWFRSTIAKPPPPEAQSEWRRWKVNLNFSDCCDYGITNENSYVNIWKWRAVSIEKGRRWCKVAGGDWFGFSRGKRERSGGDDERRWTIILFYQRRLILILLITTIGFIFSTCLSSMYWTGVNGARAKLNGGKMDSILWVVHERIFTWKSNIEQLGLWCFR